MLCNLSSQGKTSRRSLAMRATHVYHVALAAPTVANHTMLEDLPMSLSRWARYLSHILSRSGLAGVETKEIHHPFSELFYVIEVSDAEPQVGHLFRRRFACEFFPETPMHFVAYYKQQAEQPIPIGYVHCEIWRQQALGGGLVIDERAWRRIPALDRHRIRHNGGVAALLLKTAISKVPDNTIGIWAYVGDPQAKKIDLKVGFKPTSHEHIMVIWRNNPSEVEKTYWLEQVRSYGPF